LRAERHHKRKHRLLLQLLQLLQLRRHASRAFDHAHDRIQVMTLHVIKGLAFPVVVLVGAGRMPAEGEDEHEEARLFYVGTTRATQRLVIGASGCG
jgi:superfamily I DNA/RNA helicase